MNDSDCLKKGYSTMEAVLLCVPVDYQCVDLSLYKVKSMKVRNIPNLSTPDFQHDRKS